MDSGAAAKFRMVFDFLKKMEWWTTWNACNILPCYVSVFFCDSFYDESLSAFCDCFHDESQSKGEYIHRNIWQYIYIYFFKYYI